MPATFTETIGGPSGATDKYGLLCGPGNTGGSARVNDPRNDTVHLHVCINNADGVPGQCQKTPVFGVSPVASALGGPGFYIVDVFKGPTGNPRSPIQSRSTVLEELREPCFCSRTSSTPGPRPASGLGRVLSVWDSAVADPRRAPRRALGCRVVKKLMRPRTRSISAARQAAHDTAIGPARTVSWLIVGNSRTLSLP